MDMEREEFWERDELELWLSDEPNVDDAVEI
ncbi:MAG: hypothetical protein ACI87C_001674 [Paraperlucidibaca sp.]|jgi:hypothetical protein